MPRPKVQSSEHKNRHYKHVQAENNFKYHNCREKNDSSVSLIWLLNGKNDDIKRLDCCLTVKCMAASLH